MRTDARMAQAQATNNRPAQATPLRAAAQPRTALAQDALKLSARSSRPQPAAPVLPPKPAKRMLDNEANLAALKAQAAKDQMPSVITSDGKTLSYFNGALPTESKIARLHADEAISLADRITVGGKKHTVLYTDDGFAELDQRKVTVAVIDSGVAPKSRILEGRLLTGYNTGTKGTDTADDEEGHGTAVASIIAGSDTADSVAKGVSILPIKIQDWDDDKFLPQLADGIRYAADHGAKIINVSVGANFLDPNHQWELSPSDPKVHAEAIKAVSEAIAYAEEKGSLVVVAAGNEGDQLPDTVLFPASDPRVVAVSNLDDTQRPARLSKDSSRGPAVDLAAPGTKTLAWFGGGYGYHSGSSFAAPYVSGVAALIAARHPDWTPAQIKEQLYKTARDLGAPGKDDSYGHGAVNAIEAVFGK
ncbi:S8 family serine peptidase [bacterium]|nr:S8 family serine peptidase [bacterium]